MADLMRVRFTLSGLEGLPGVHTSYWKGASSTPVTADCVDVCARVRAFWDAIKGLMASGVTISGPQSVDVISEITGDLTGQLTPGALTSVSATGTSSMASATMILLRYNTTLIVGSRRLQGRSYIGPVGTNTNANGNVQSSSNATLLSGAASFNTGATASALQVWHRPTQSSPVGGIASAVTGYGTATEFAVLRSRRQ